MKEKYNCLQARNGSCLGCNILKIAITRVRWNGQGLSEAKVEIAKEYCPSGFLPQIERAINNQASSGMGQRREENLEIVGSNIRCQKIHF